jgi:uncharacterized protein YceH (UPF0502 family)
MAEFDSVGEVQDELAVLAAQPEPLVRFLARRPGQKEDRWQQLLAAESASEAVGSTDDPRSPDLPGETLTGGTTSRPMGPDVDHPDLEHQVESLSSEVAAIRDQVAELSDSLTALRQSLGE